VFNHEIYATSFARAVELLRDRRATKDQQKSALRALVALSGLSSATLRVYDGGLSIDDVSIPLSLPGVANLIERFDRHGLAEVMCGKAAEPRELLALVKTLAGEPGGKSVKEQLRDAESKKVMVILRQAQASLGPTHRAMSVTQAFEVEEIEALAAKAPEVEAAKKIDSALAEWEASATAGLATAGEIDLGFTLEETGAAAPAELEPLPPPSPVEPPEARPPLEAALTDLAADPYGRDILDRLTDLSALILAALREDRVAVAVSALGVIVGFEPGAPDGTPRNSYGIVLRRTLTRDVLSQIAPYALDTHLTEEVAVVLRRGRGEAAEVLLGLLASAEGMRERRSFMQVLKSMPQGVEQVIHMLDHHQWFVARNVAELMGDMRIEESAGPLGQALGHADHRVRHAAAVALAKIGTPATVEPLRRALKEGDAELRIQVATSIGRASRALAMPLVALIETEQNPEVVKEYYAALGRIGSPDAVQALVKAAAPGGMLVGRKSAGVRIAAVEGLRLAGAVRQLEVLQDDSDRQVREVTRRALDELRKAT
jgi:HEAT repeat protein